MRPSIQTVPATASPGRGTPTTAVEYPYLLRTPHTRWWHPVAGAAVLLVGWAILAGVLTSLLSTAGGADVERGTSALDVATVGLTIAVGLPAAVVAVVLVHRRHPGVLVSVTRRPRAGLFVVAAAVAMAAFVPMMLAKTAAFDAGPDSTGGAVGWVGWQAFLPLFAAVVLVFPLQAAAEEVVFRGYLTQALATWTHRVWPAALASSLMFVAIHPTQDAWIFADRLFFALALCWLTWRTGGLEAAIAVHVAYNLLLGLAVAATGRMDAMVHASRSDALGSLTSMAGTALVVLTIVWWAQGRRVAVRTVPEGEAP